MESPKVSIIIPCYNYAHYLPETIESVLNQTFKDYEIIVVDDGSTDNTEEVSSRYPVKLIKQDNKGLAGARNSGISWARGEYILPLDADDKIEPDFLEKTVAEIEKGFDIVGTAQKEFGDRNTTHVFKTHPQFEDFFDNNQMNCCSLFKRRMWVDLNGYDESMCLGYEDWDLWLRATNKGYKVSILPLPLFLYRIHGDSMINNTRKHHFELVAHMRNKLK